MDVGLVPNIEPAQKYVDFFASRPMKQFVPSQTFIPVEGGIVVVDPQPKLPPDAKVQLISAPEAARQQAEATMKEDRADLSIEGVKAMKRKRKAQTLSGEQGGKVKRKKGDSWTSAKIADVFSS